jgi:hypothetical protein
LYQIKTLLDDIIDWFGNIRKDLQKFKV